MSGQMMYGPQPHTTHTGGIPQHSAVIEPAEAEETVPAAKRWFGSGFSEVPAQTVERVATTPPETSCTSS